MRNAAMAMVIEDEEKLYNYKNIHELKLPDWPSHTGQWRKYKSELTRIFAAWDWTGSTLSKWAKIAMNPNGKEGSCQRLLNWLTNESQGAERFDAILGSMTMDPKKTTLKSSPWYSDLRLYQDRCTSLDLPIKFRPLLLIVAEHMRVEESKANFTSSRVIFECKFPGHEPEQVRAFQTQVHLLLNSMKKLLDPSEFF